MEDYKEKYEQALENIKKIKAANKDNKELMDFIEYQYPELKENEGERIRKEIIKVFTGETGFTTKEEAKKYVAWLEKQGEKKVIDKIQLGKKYRCIASPRYSTFMIGEIYKPEDKFLCSLMNFCSDCFEPIEDDEQKSTNKIGPKFKKE